MPQWTMSWSSTTRTQSARGRRAGRGRSCRRRRGRGGDGEKPDVPAVGRRAAEVDGGAELQRLEGRQAQADAGAGGRARADAVVDDRDRDRVARRARRRPRSLVGRACLRALRTASATTVWASGSSAAGISASSAQQTVRFGSACSSARRHQLLAQRRLDTRATARASGRWIAVRSSSVAACSSSAQRSRWGAVRSPGAPSASATPNRRWTTRSCTSRARSSRSPRWRARSCWRVAARAERGERADLAEGPQALALGGGERPAARSPALGEHDAVVAPAGRHRDARDVGEREPLDVALRQRR